MHHAGLQKSNLRLNAPSRCLCVIILLLLAAVVIHQHRLWLPASISRELPSRQLQQPSLEHPTNQGESEILPQRPSAPFHWRRFESRSQPRALFWFPHWIVDASCCTGVGSTSSPVVVSVLVYLHGAGEAGDDLRSLLTKRGAMGTPPQIVEGTVVNDAHGMNSDDERYDGASASATSHPLRNGSLRNTVVVAPQSLFGWPDDPDALDNVASMILSWKRLGALDCSALSDARGANDQTHATRRGHKNSVLPWCLRIRVDPQSIVVSGASQGGFAVLELAARGAGSRFLALCGFCLSSSCSELALRTLNPPGILADVVDRKTSPRVVLLHGRNDEMVPQSASRDWVEAVSVALARKHFDTTSLLRTVVIPAGKPFSSDVVDAVLRDASAGQQRLRPAVVFIDMEETRHPLDIGYSGHAAWRDAFSAGSVVWNWLS